MNVKIKLSIRNNPLTPTLKRMLNALSKSGRKAVMLEMGRELLNITQEQFGPDKPNRPAPWPPLSDSYKKKIKYFGPPKLILSGALHDSFTIRATSTEVFVTAHKPYAEYQQFGTNKMPMRPYFPVVDGELTPYAEERIRERGEAAVILLSEG
jgi:phage gpG-like protein